MSLVVALIIGAVVGWLAASLSGRNEGFLGSIIIGVIGAYIGGTLASLFGSDAKSSLALSWRGAIWTFIGAVILSSLLNAIQHKSHRNVYNGRR